MAVPGFSVTELIQAAGHFKIVYDGFFSKHSNSASKIRDLADHIQEFQTNLQAHKEVIESRGLEYSNLGYGAIKRTLDECEDFLNKYSAVLDKKISAERFWRTGRLQYELDTVARLQNRIDSHKISILQFNSNILMYVISQCVACAPWLIISLTISIGKMANVNLKPSIFPHA